MIDTVLGSVPQGQVSGARKYGTTNLWIHGFSRDFESNDRRDVQRRLGSIKQEYFDEILDKMIESIF